MKASELIRILQTLKPDDHITLNVGELVITPDDATTKERDAWARQWHKDASTAAPTAEDVEHAVEVQAEDGQLRVFFPGEAMWIVPIQTGKNGGSGVLISVPLHTNGWRASKHKFHPGHGARSGDLIHWTWTLFQGAEKERQFSNVQEHTAKSAKIAEKLFADRAAADRKAAKKK